MTGLTRDTLAEMRDRKLLWIFGIVVSLAVLAVLMTNNFEVQFQATTNGDVDAAELNKIMGDPVLRGFTYFNYFLVFFAVMGAAGSLPRMFERGRAEFYLSKPISRQSLYLKKLSGLWVTYGGLVLVSMLVVYLAVGLFHGIWNPAILSLAGLSMVTVLIWLVISGFFAMLFGSTGTVVMSLFLVWAAEFVLAFHEAFKQLVGLKWAGLLIDGLYYVVPKVSSTARIFSHLSGGQAIPDWSPLWTTALVTGVLLLVTMSIMRKRDF